MIKNIRVCDGCGKELKMAADTYHIDFESETFWNFTEIGYGLDVNKIKIDLCERCCRDAVNSLRRIAKGRKQ